MVIHSHSGYISGVRGVGGGLGGVVGRGGAMGIFISLAPASLRVANTTRKNSQEATQLVLTQKNKNATFADTGTGTSNPLQQGETHRRVSASSRPRSAAQRRPP